MSREIKFRAWHKKENLMGNVMNLPLSNEPSDYLEIDLGPMVAKPFLTDEPEEFEIMQYTGLKDKNGVEIYEGDVVEVKRDNPVWDSPIIDNEVVEYVGAKFKMGKQLTLSNDYAMISVKVIGNIHQNPELLEH